MNSKFDELTKQLAQSTTRRQALKRFGVGLAGMALACFGLAGKAEAGQGCTAPKWCNQSLNPCCCTSTSGRGGNSCKTALPKACPNYADCAFLCNSGKGFGC
jgi:hypothetical protein